VVAVAPSTGNISFWENIDSAYAQRHHGLQGTVKLYSGESITSLVEVGHAGYVLISSTGRLVHLTLRDAQGRPSIVGAILSAPSNSNGSFFSFKGLLGGSTRKTIAAVKARPSQSKGHMDVITATRAGLFQRWEMDWSGQHNFIAEVDVQSQIASAVRPDTAPESQSLNEVQVLDFAIMEQRRSQGDVKLLLLAASSRPDSLDYALLEVHLSNTGSTISRAIPIRNFQQPQIPAEPTGVLLLPGPGHTAFILFPGAVCITSLAQPEESPENQILADAGRLTLPYQDAVYFREDVPVNVSGHALDDGNVKDRRASVLIFIQQFGVLKISAQPPTDDDKDVERARVTARSKLEQATLFGTAAGNLLDFSTKSRFSFPADEVAQAAVDVSSAILNSSYESLAKVTSSMDDHFRTRANALRMLIKHLRSDYPSLPFETKWRLLGQAEKLASAHQLWSWYQDKLQDQQQHPDSYPENILLGDIIKALHERYKTALQPDIGETDNIRQFFIKDIDSLQILVPWGWFYLRTFYVKDGFKEHPSVMQRLSEGTDIVLVTLEAAYAFRQANIESYDLKTNSIEDGILLPNCGYNLLPSIWTSSHNIVSSIRSLVDVGRNLAVSCYEAHVLEGPASKIAAVNPRLVKLGCQTHIERFLWAQEQSNEKEREMGKSLEREWNTNVRPLHIMGLMEVGLATEGMKLAEQYEDMSTLVNLVWEETEWLQTQKNNPQLTKMEHAESGVKLKRLAERIGRYFDLYGESWAEAFYSKHVSCNRAAQLFMSEYLNQPALTKYLRAQDSRARLRWINEVIGEKQYGGAARSLFDAATKQETNSWCQRVELSLAKLAKLGEEEAGPVPETKPKTRSKRAKDPTTLVNISQKLEYAKLQEDVYDQLSPIITGALDDEGAIELLMTAFGQGRLRQRPAHQSVLKEGFENMIQHKVIDPGAHGLGRQG
jgi:nuclear pore complex protein Nup133